MARMFTASSSQYLTRASAVLDAAPISMACWFRPSNVAGGTSKSLMAIDDGSANNFFLLRSVASTGTVSAAINDGVASGASTTSGTQTDNAWGHCGAVFAAADSRTAYLNGEAATTDTTSSTPTGVNVTNIGRLANVQFTDGDIGEAAIWRVALSGFDFYRLSQGISPLKIQPAYLVAYWPLVGGASPEPDRWQGNFPLIVTNAPPVSAAVPPMIHLATSTGRARRRRVA